jgi:hypothetical protein
MVPDNAPVVKRGQWLYDGTITCEVRIVRHDVLYGSGDYEDPPEISNDREVECCYLLFHTPVGLPEWGRGGAALSLADAISIAEAMKPTLKWTA